MKTRDLVFKIKRSFIRALKFHGDRPSSAPYISGDTFRALADHTHEKERRVDPKKIRESHVVLVEGDLIDDYFEHIHPNIKYRYILLTHNSDRNIGAAELNRIDRKIIHWYAQNLTAPHLKASPLPIGLENLHYYQNGVPSLFDRTRAKNYPKIPKILYGFSVSTNPAEREPALEELRRCPLAKEINDWPSPQKYLETVARHQFLASPEGNGLDCHRTWEALYLNVVPIVKRSAMSEHFASLGLPIWLIKDWQEIENLTEEDLARRYSDLVSKADDRSLWLDYWKKLFKQIND